MAQKSGIFEAANKVFSQGLLLCSVARKSSVQNTILIKNKQTYFCHWEVTSDNVFSKEGVWGLVFLATAILKLLFFYDLPTLSLKLL